MIARTGSGWQYVLADLSLILFMVTAAALAQAQDVPSPGRPAAKAQPAKTQALSSQGEPVAIYRAVPNAPPLHQWLRDQLADERQQLTIVAHYRPGKQADAMTIAQALVQDAGDAGKKARIVVEPGTDDAMAILAFDTPAGSRVGK